MAKNKKTTKKNTNKKDETHKNILEEIKLITSTGISLLITFFTMILCISPIIDLSNLLNEEFGWNKFDTLLFFYMLVVFVLYNTTRKITKYLKNMKERLEK